MGEGHPEKEHTEEGYTGKDIRGTYQGSDGGGHTEGETEEVYTEEGHTEEGQKKDKGKYNIQRRRKYMPGNMGGLSQMYLDALVLSICCYYACSLAISIPIHAILGSKEEYLYAYILLRP